MCATNISSVCLPHASLSLLTLSACYLSIFLAFLHRICFGDLTYFGCFIYLDLFSLCVLSIFSFLYLFIPSYTLHSSWRFCLLLHNKTNRQQQKCQHDTVSQLNCVEICVLPVYWMIKMEWNDWYSSMHKTCYIMKIN